MNPLSTTDVRSLPAGAFDGSDLSIATNGRFLIYTIEELRGPREWCKTRDSAKMVPVRPPAGVAKLADARDSKSRASQGACGFDSHLRHQSYTGDMTTSSLKRVLLTVLAVGLASCASMKTPVLQVEGLKFDRLRVTGAGLDVNFRVQNPNPEAVVIERFEYELKLNGRRLGRGYHSEPIRLDGFKDERLSSRFSLNFLSVPGAVREVMDDNRANVEIKGDFYVLRESGGHKKMGFKNNARVDVGK